MAQTMELTESEAALIEEMRRKDREEKVYRKVTLEALQTAYEYERWLQMNGYGSSYSTFCDDFGFGADGQMFNLVERIRTVAITRSSTHPAPAATEPPQ
jgi:hypothetical protein